ncbi:MAG: energy-coupling factor transporter transmembrane protein EcfT, partial [Chloroflexi bacterium]|nr:energy-coupling factor transporter transmembrane protein EcfT [Chloroflexota bacterium]
RPGGGLRWRARVSGHLVGTLFVRSIERSERVHAAMLARGYDGEARRLAPFRLDARSAAVGAVILLYGCCVQLAVRL